MIKSSVLARVQQALAEELEALTRGAHASFAAATDPDSRAENKYDTRTLEASYVARGQAQRVAEVQEAMRQFQALGHDLPETTASVRLGSLITLNDTQIYFMGPAAGGTEIEIDGEEVLVITPASPLGQLLMGRSPGDSVKLPAGPAFRISAVCLFYLNL